MTLKHLFKKHSKSLRYQGWLYWYYHTPLVHAQFKPLHIHCLISEGMVDIERSFCL